MYDGKLGESINAIWSRLNHRLNQGLVMFLLRWIGNLVCDYMQSNLLFSHILHIHYGDFQGIWMPRIHLGRYCTRVLYTLIYAGVSN
jgi:hypothetical protein